MHAIGRIRRSPSLLVTIAPDDCLAFDVRTRVLHRLSPAAALVLELCDGGRTRAQLLADLAPLGADMPAWLDHAVGRGWLEPAPPRPASSRTPSAASLASLAARLRDTDRVLAAYVCQDAAARLAPDDPDHWLELGELAHIVGRRDAAREAYERYHTHRPEDGEVAHILAALRDEPMPDRASDRCIEQLYDRFATFYDESMTDELDYRVPEIVATALDESLGADRPLRILELGCGTGLTGRRLRPLAAHLTGVDLSPAMLARASLLRIYDDLHTAELTTWLASATGRYDAVVLADTLIYFGDLIDVIGSGARVLTPGGALVFTVERSTAAPVQLTDSGRYAHHADHVRAAVAAAGLAVDRLEACILRHEYGQPVAGLLAVARRIWT